MNKLIKTVLLANSSQIGYNWMYNRKFLLDESKKHQMLMQLPKLEDYQNYKPSYYAYPNNSLGGLTLQGEILVWLYNDIKKHDNYSANHYKALLLKHLMPGGLYSGYVESYGLKLVYNEIAKINKLNEITLDDDQLVGFMPYIAYKALNKDINESFELINVLTNLNDYKMYINVFEHLFKEGKDKLFSLINLMPKAHQSKVRDAIITNNVESIIKSTSDLSCSLIYAMPIIFYLYNKHHSLFEALKENVIIGGASSDRALILGLLFENDLPDEWNGYLEI